MFGYGHFAVCVFIVLSGFGLMLPLARGGAPVCGEASRRTCAAACDASYPPTTRHLPCRSSLYWRPHVFPVGRQMSRTTRRSARARSRRTVFVHNWNFDWVYRINGPMWSVATEWQIYFLFPLLLLPLWRRVGGPEDDRRRVGDCDRPRRRAARRVRPLMGRSVVRRVVRPRHVGCDVGFLRHRFRPRRLRDLRWGWVTRLALTLVVIVVATDPGWQPSIVDGIVSVFALL